MDYIKKLKAKVEDAGELMVVLESDREYKLHPHDTEFDYETGEITTEGMKDGEYSVVTFPASAVEHYYIHKENWMQRYTPHFTNNDRRIF